MEKQRWVKCIFFFTLGAHILAEGINMHVSSCITAFYVISWEQEFLKCLGNLRMGLGPVHTEVGFWDFCIPHQWALGRVKEAKLFLIIYKKKEFSSFLKFVCFICLWSFMWSIECSFEADFSVLSRTFTLGHSNCWFWMCERKLNAL